MRSASTGSLVSAAPPSPVVMIFTGWKLNTAMSECSQKPTRCSPNSAPTAWEASSSTRKPNSWASAPIRSMSHG
jgi:hypothetical protein